MPGPMTNVQAFSGRNSRFLVLKKDGSVVGWSAFSDPVAMTGVTAVAAGGLYSLVLSTNPPTPRLSINADLDGLRLSSFPAVSGYVLESTTALGLPFTPFDFEYEPVTMGEMRQPLLTLPATHASRFFRLRKE